MKPPKFGYVAPATVEDAVAALRDLAGDAKVLAGGQSLIPLLNFRLSAPAHLVDINGVTALQGVQFDDGLLRLGALTRHQTLERDARIAQAAPLLPKAAVHIGHPQIRTRGTLGGSLAHADPSAELPTAMIALDATIVAQSHRGQRRIPAGEFFTFHLSTVLADDELVVAVEMPVRQRREGSAFLEVAARQGDFAAAGAAVIVAIEGVVITDARIVCSSVGPTPVRIPEAEAVVRGQVASPALLREVEDTVRRHLEPTTQLKVSATYKRRTAAVLARRALEAAIAETAEEVAA